MSYNKKVIEPFFKMIEEVCEDNEEVSEELGKHFFEQYFKHMRKVATDDKIPIMIFPGIGRLRPVFDKLEDRINKLKDQLKSGSITSERVREKKLEELKILTDNYERIKKESKEYGTR